MCEFFVQVFNVVYGLLCVFGEVVFYIVGDVFDYVIYMWFFKEVICVFDFGVCDCNVFLFVQFVYQIGGVCRRCYMVVGVVNDQVR